jgi:hypothetical protein
LLNSGKMRLNRHRDVLGEPLICKTESELRKNSLSNKPADKVALP